MPVLARTYKRANYHNGVVKLEALDAYGNFLPLPLNHEIKIDSVLCKLLTIANYN